MAYATRSILAQFSAARGLASTVASRSAAGGRSQDPAHSHVTTHTESYEDESGATKTRKIASCDHCGMAMVFSNIGRFARHLTGDSLLCQNSGGIVVCTEAPLPVQQRFKARVMEQDRQKAHLERMLAARRANDLAARGRANPSADTDDVATPPLKAAKGPLELAFEKLTVKDAEDAHAMLLFENPAVASRFFASASFTRYIKVIKNSPGRWKPPPRQKLLGAMLDDKVDSLKLSVRVRA